MNGWIGFIIGVVMMAGVIGPLFYLHDKDLKFRCKERNREAADKYQADTRRIVGKILSIVQRTEVSTASTEWLNNTQCVRTVKAFIQHTLEELQGKK